MLPSNLIQVFSHAVASDVGADAVKPEEVSISFESVLSSGRVTEVGAQLSDRVAENPEDTVAAVLSSVRSSHVLSSELAAATHPRESALPEGVSAQPSATTFSDAIVETEANAIPSQLGESKFTAGVIVLADVPGKLATQGSASDNGTELPSSGTSPAESPGSPPAAGVSFPSGATSDLFADSAASSRHDRSTASETREVDPVASPKIDRTPEELLGEQTATDQVSSNPERSLERAVSASSDDASPQLLAKVGASTSKASTTGDPAESLSFAPFTEESLIADAPRDTGATSSSEAFDQGSESIEQIRTGPNDGITAVQDDVLPTAVSYNVTGDRPVAPPNESGTLHGGLKRDAPVTVSREQPAGSSEVSAPTESDPVTSRPAVESPSARDSYRGKSPTQIQSLPVDVPHAPHASLPEKGTEATPLNRLDLPSPQSVANGNADASVDPHAVAPDRASRVTAQALTTDTGATVSASNSTRADAASASITRPFSTGEASDIEGKAAAASERTSQVIATPVEASLASEVNSGESDSTIEPASLQRTQYAAAQFGPARANASAEASQPIESPPDSPTAESAARSTPRPTETTESSPPEPPVGFDRDTNSAYSVAIDRARVALEQSPEVDWQVTPQSKASTDSPTLAPVAPHVDVGQAPVADAIIRLRDSMQTLQPRDITQQVMSVVSESVESSDGERVRTVEIELQPAELGRLRVRIERTAESIATQIIASELISSELLASKKESLQSALNDLGFGEASVDVSHQENRQMESRPDTGRARVSRTDVATEGPRQDATPTDSASGLDIIA